MVFFFKSLYNQKSEVYLNFIVYEQILNSVIPQTKSFSFTAINHTDEGCILQYNSKYEKISIQHKQIHGEWNPLSETSTETTTVGDINEVKVNNLNLGYSYEFRGFFENNNGEIVQLTSKESIKIKSKILYCLLFC